jgi:enamine deaminase RidA (YjgF/YER057c/UK114 family)
MPAWEARLAELGLVLPDPIGPGGLYSPVVVADDIAYTAGVVAMEGAPPRIAWAGCVGDDLTIDDARASARAAMLGTLANLRAALGTLDRVERLIKLTGFVQAVPGFDRSPAVMNGASELLAEIFGSELLPVRTVVSVSGLPGGASVEIDTVVALS